MPHHAEIDQKWVVDYHDILTNIEEQTGFDLSAFRVSESEFHHPVIGARRGSWSGTPGTVTRSKKITVPLPRLLHKMDAVLSYFQYQQNAGPTPKQAIGFKAP